MSCETLDGKELTIICSGTQMIWEEMALLLNLPINTPHNLNDPNAEGYYFCLDGVAVNSKDDTHYAPADASLDTKALEEMLKQQANGEIEIADDENSEISVQSPSRYIKTTRKSALSRKKDWFCGNGMTDNARIAYNLVKKLKEHKNIKKINIVGFSRGGATAIMIANLLAKTFATKDIPVDIFAIDPVAGPTKNDHEDLQTIPANVQRYIACLAVDEAVIGFEPRDFSKTVFLSDRTQYCYLTFPQDHLETVRWSEVLLPQFIDAPYLYKNAEFDKEELREACHKGGHPHWVGFEDREKLFKADDASANNVAEINKKNVEKYYEHFYLSSANEKTIQNSASRTTRLVGRVSRRLNNRRIKRELARYSKNNMFVNLHHEYLFSKSYPAIYRYMQKENPWEISPQELEIIRKEFADMPSATVSFIWTVMNFSGPAILLNVNHLVKLNEKAKHRPYFSGNVSIKEMGQLFGGQGVEKCSPTTLAGVRKVIEGGISQLAKKPVENAKQLNDLIDLREQLVEIDTDPTISPETKQRKALGVVAWYLPAAKGADNSAKTSAVYFSRLQEAHNLLENPQKKNEELLDSFIDETGRFTTLIKEILNDLHAKRNDLVQQKNPRLNSEKIKLLEEKIKLLNDFFVKNAELIFSLTEMKIMLSENILQYDHDKFAHEEKNSKRILSAIESTLRSKELSPADKYIFLKNFVKGELFLHLTEMLKELTLDLAEVNIASQRKYKILNLVTKTDTRQKLEGATDKIRQTVGQSKVLSKDDKSYFHRYATKVRSLKVC